MAITSVFLLPLTNTPQSFQITMSGTNYVFVNKWNDSPDGGWAIDIFDSNSVPIAMNCPLITGTDMMAGLEYLEFGGQFFVANLNGIIADQAPTLDNLGVNVNVYYETVIT